jgi:hypothetical protein
MVTKPNDHFFHPGKTSCKPSLMSTKLPIDIKDIMVKSESQWANVSFDKIIAPQR